MADRPALPTESFEIVINGRPLMMPDVCLSILADEISLYCDSPVYPDLCVSGVSALFSELERRGLAAFRFSSDAPRANAKGPLEHI